MRRAGATASGVHVAVRVRPMNEMERQTAGCFEAVETGETYLILKQGDQAESTYAFDSVFGPDSSTAEMYEKVAEPIVSSCLTGINGTIFAYGQTASGKTFTMQGKESHPGILRLAARKLFEPNEKWTYSLTVSYMEIYNEKIKDLLSGATSKAAAEAACDLKIREDPQRGFFVEGLVEASVTTYEQLLDKFQEGEKRRHVAGTDMNEKSSRSHTVFAMNITAKPSAGNNDAEFMGGVFKSRLSLVDLAGSENVRNTNAEGERLKEGGQINKSLLTLSMVIATLAKSSGAAKRGEVSGAGHVKFRDSKLTQILQPSLVGNCRTAVICCVTPASIFTGETSSTLKFANSAKNIKTEFVVNQIVDATRSLKSYQEQVEALQNTLRVERMELESLRAAGGNHALELDKFKDEIMRLTEDLMDKTHKLHASETDLKLKEEELIEIEQQLDTALSEAEQKELDHLRVLEEKENIIRITANDLNEEKEKTKALEREMERSSRMLAETKSTLQEVTATLHKERDRSSAFEVDRANLKDELERSMQVQADLTAELASSKSSCSNLAAGLKHAESEVTNLRMELGQVQMNLEKSVSVARTLDDEKNKLSSDLKDARRKHDEQLEQVTNEMREVTMTYEAKVKEYESRIGMIQAGKDGAERSVKELELNRTALETELEQTKGLLDREMVRTTAMAADHSSTVSEYERRLTELTSASAKALAHVEAKLVESAHTVIELSRKLGEAESNRSLLQEALNSLGENAGQREKELILQCNNLQGEVAKLKKTMGDVETELKETQETLQTSQSTLKQVTDEKVAVEADLAQKTTALCESRALVALLQTELQQSLTAHECALSDRETTISSLNAKVQALETTVSELELVKDQLAEDLNAGQKCIRTLENEIETLRGSLNLTKSSLDQNLKATMDELAEAQRATETTERARANLEKEVSKLSGDIEHLHQEREAIKSQAEQRESHLTKELECRQLAIKKLTKELEASEEALQLLKKDLASAEADLAAKTEALRAADAESAMRIDELGLINKTLQTTKEELAVMREDLVSKDKTLQTTTADLMATNDELRLKGGALLKTQHDLALVKEELVEARKGIEDLQGDSSRSAEEWMSKMDALQQAERALKTNIALQKEQVAALEQTNSDLLSAKVTLELELTKLQESLNELNLDLEGERMDREDVDRLNKETLEALVAERDVLNEQVMVLQMMVNDAELDRDGLEEERTCLLRQREQLNQLVEGLQMEVNSVSFERDGLHEELKTVTTHLNSSINQVSELVAEQDVTTQLAKQLKELLEVREQDLELVQEELNATAMDRNGLHMELKAVIDVLQGTTTKLEKTEAELQIVKESLSLENSSMVKERDTLRVELDTLEKEKAALHETVEDVQTEVNDLATTNLGLDLELHAIMDQLENVQEMFNNCAVDRDGLSCEVDCVRDELELVQQESNHYSFEMDGHALEVACVREELARKEAERTELESRIEVKDALIKQQVENLGQVERDLASTQDEVNSLWQLCTGERMNSEALSGQIALLEAERKSLQAHIEELSSTRSASESQFAQTAKEARHVKDELEATKRELELQEKELAHVRGESVEQLKFREALELKIAEYQQEMNRLQLEMDGLELEHGRLQEQTNRMHIEMDGLEMEYSDVVERTEKYQDELNRLHSDMDGLEMELTESVRMSELKEKALESRVAEKEAQMQSVQAEKDALTSVNAKLESLVEQYQRDINELHLDLAGMVLEQRVCEINVAKDIQIYLDQIKSLKKDKKAVESENLHLVQLQQHMAAKQGDIGEFKLQLGEKEAEIQRLTSAIQAMEHTMDEELGKLQKEKLELDKSLKEKCVELDEQEEKWRRFLDDTERLNREECEALQTKLDQALATVDELRNKVVSLESAVQDASALRELDAKVQEKDRELSEARSRMADMTAERDRLATRNEKLEKNKLTKKDMMEIEVLKREYLALKTENARLSPASPESVMEYERRIAEATKSRDEAIEKLKQFTVSAKEREEVLEETRKRQVRDLEKENLGLYKKLKEVGALGSRGYVASEVARIERVLSTPMKGASSSSLGSNVLANKENM